MTINLPIFPFLAQLEHLETLNLEDNPLNPALQSAYNQGLDALKAYLRSLEKTPNRSTKPNWCWSAKATSARPPCSRR